MTNYPGYEIDLFENEGGCCEGKCTVCESIVEDDDGTEQNQQMPGRLSEDSEREQKEM